MEFSFTNHGYMCWKYKHATHECDLPAYNFKAQIFWLLSKSYKYVKISSEKIKGLPRRFIKKLFLEYDIHLPFSFK